MQGSIFVIRIPELIIKLINYIYNRIIEDKSLDVRLVERSPTCTFTILHGSKIKDLEPPACNLGSYWATFRAILDDSIDP